jgi:hypothetical protein
MDMDVFAFSSVGQRLGVGHEIITRPFLATTKVISQEDTASNAVPEFLLVLVWPLGLIPDPRPERHKVSCEGFASSPFVWCEVVWPRVGEVVEAGEALSRFSPPFVAKATGKEESFSSLDRALYSALGHTVGLGAVWCGDVVRNAKLTQR